MAETTTPASKPPSIDTPRLVRGSGQPAPHEHISGHQGPIDSPKQDASDVGPDRRPPDFIPPILHDTTERPPMGPNISHTKGSDPGRDSGGGSPVISTPLSPNGPPKQAT